MDFFSGLWSWFTGGSFFSGLAKTALLGYASRLINDNVNQSQIQNATTKPPVVDKGVRLQLKADTQNKIPVLYGEAFFGGNLTDARISDDYKKMTYCITLAEAVGPKFSTGSNTSYEFIGVYINNNRVQFKSDGITVNYTVDQAGNQDVSMSGLIKICLYRGSTGIQPNGYSGSTPAPSSIMLGWGSGNFPMTNLIYAVVEITYNKAKNVYGLPDLQFNIENDMKLPGDVLVDYMMSTRYGAGIAPEEIDGVALTALNTYGNTGFSYQTSSGQTQSGKIQINGLIDTNTTVLTNMEELAKCSNSWISYNIHAGLWTVVINQPATAVATFDDSNIVGEISVSGTSLTQLNNSVDVKYQNKDIKDKTDYVKITLPEEDLFQNEPKSTLQLSLPFINSQAVALRVGIQSLKQHRIDKIISFQTDYSFINITAGDVIGVTSDIYGFSSKLFRVISTEEVEGETGEIEVRFTCLEYDLDVYAGDISEYAIETNDGLFNINAIGKPPKPTVQKFEKLNIPYITSIGRCPTGIVEVLEFWITFDVDLPNDDDRIYEQFASFRKTSGALLVFNQECKIKYSQLNAGKFYIKVRGANSIVTGPYSDPSDLVDFKPEVVADNISDEPVPDINNIFMNFGLLTLMSLLNSLMNNIFGPGSLFNKIFDLFKDITGFDLLDWATNGGSGGTPGTSDCCNKICRLDWNLDCALPSNCHDPKTAGSYVNPQGPFKFKLSGGNGTYEKGTGGFHLHKSDGTVVQSVAASSVTITGNTVTIPFTAAQAKGDYYITWDDSTIKTTDDPPCTLPKNESKTNWAFHTEESAFVRECPQPPTPPPTPATPCPPLVFQGVRAKTYDCTDDNNKADVTTAVGFDFNQPVFVQNSGTVTVSDGSTTKQYNLATSKHLFRTEGNTVWFKPSDDFEKGGDYSISFTGGSFKNKCDQTTSGLGSFKTDPGPKADIDIGVGDKAAFDTGASFNFDRPVDEDDPNATIDIIDYTRGTTHNVPFSSGAVSRREG